VTRFHVPNALWNAARVGQLAIYRIVVALLKRIAAVVNRYWTMAFGFRHGRKRVHKQGI
jgi:hypothetical protein